MIRGAIFDMDGLMFDTERLWDTVWEPVCQKLGLTQPDDLESFYATGRGMAGACLHAHILNYFPTADPIQVVNEAQRLAAERFAKGVPCKPGLRELLDTLAQRRIPCIVASSSPRELILQNLKNTNTNGYFVDVVCGDDVQHSKPAPDIFLLAAQRIQVDIRHCLVLEDSFNGVRAGHAAGAVTIMVPDLAQPTAEIRSLYTHCCRSLFEVRDLLLAGKL